MHQSIPPGPIPTRATPGHLFRFSVPGKGRALICATRGQPLGNLIHHGFKTIKSPGRQDTYFVPSRWSLLSLYILYFRSVTFVFPILDFNIFYFLWRTSLKTTYLRDGRFLLKDCFYLFIIIFCKKRYGFHVTVASPQRTRQSC